MQYAKIIMKINYMLLNIFLFFRYVYIIYYFNYLFRNIEKKSINKVFLNLKINKYKIHAKYIPEAVNCLINICSSNEYILMNLSENLKV